MSLWVVVVGRSARQSVHKDCSAMHTQPCSLLLLTGLIVCVADRRSHSWLVGGLSLGGYSGVSVSLSSLVMKGIRMALVAHPAKLYQKAQSANGVVEPFGRSAGKHLFNILKKLTVQQHFDPFIFVREKNRHRLRYYEGVTKFTEVTLNDTALHHPRSSSNS